MNLFKLLPLLLLAITFSIGFVIYLACCLVIAFKGELDNMINEDFFKDDDDKDKFKWIKPENRAYFWYTVLVLVMMLVGLNLDPFIEEVFK